MSARSDRTRSGAAPLAPLPADPGVAVVIPVRNGADGLTEAVSAALQPEVDELVIAVGPSQDGTEQVAEQLARRHGRVAVVANPAGRTADGLNAGIAATVGEVVVRVDAHARLPEGYVARAVDQLRATGAANVGGRQVPVATGGFARCVAAAMRSRVGAGGATYRVGGAAGPVDTVYLGVFRRQALETVGGFDPAFVRNQDAELNLRLRRAGYQVWFDPQLAVRYRPRDSVASLARQYREYGAYRRLTARRHARSLAPRQLAAPAVVVGLAGAAATSLLTRDLRPVALATAAYAGLLGGAATAAADEPAEAPGVAIALGTMHLSWGVGFLYGPPRSGRGGETHVRP
jgi:succinoglycan biosynthesis protein ExoA